MIAMVTMEGTLESTMMEVITTAKAKATATATIKATTTWTCHRIHMVSAYA